MTRSPVGRRGAQAPRSGWLLEAGSFLTALLVIGLILRVFIAGIYLPLSGFAIDIGDFAVWGQRLAAGGPGAFYEPGYFSDYPPAYLYVLWLLGWIGGLLGALVGQDATAALVKIPGIAADVGVAALLYVIARRWAAQLLAGFRPARDAELAGLAAAAAYLFNPAVIFDSAVWGQVDSVGTLVLLGTVYCLARGWTEAASVLAVLALLVKFQYGLIIPVVAIVGLRRHLGGRSADPAHDGRREPIRALTSVVAAVVTLFVVMLPFEMTLYAPLAGGDPRGLLGFLPEADPNHSLIGKFVEAGGTYTGLTVNAMNLWRNPWSGLGDTLRWGSDTDVAFAGLTWQAVGAGLFLAVAAIGLWLVARRDDARGILLALLLLSVAFFVLPTRVHERYMFPALALAAPFLLRGPRWQATYGALSLLVFANIYWVYTEDWSFAGPRIMNPGLGGGPMQQDPFLSATLLTDTGIYLLSAMSVAILGVIAWRALRLGLRPADDPVPARAVIAQAAPVTAAVAPVVAPAGDEAVRSSSSLSFLRWLRPRAADPYLREPGRRLDRRDAALLLGLVLFALVFRLWRLDTPRAMHFDEVYHARSAAEWLANWQNGWKRDVYEWTHPMLAKYLIAAGIVVADPNRVLGSAPLDGPTAAMVVAPARAAYGHERSVVFSAGGTRTITARDSETGEELASWEAGGPVASLAIDDRSGQLLAGRNDAGLVERWELAAFMASRGVRAPPAALAAIDTGLEAVNQLVAPDDSELLLARGPTGLATIEGTNGIVLASVEVASAGIAYLPSHNDHPERVVATLPAANEIAFFDAVTLEPATSTPRLAVDAPLIGPLVTRGTGDGQQIFALTGPVDANAEHAATDGGLAVADGDEQRLVDVAPLPGVATGIAWHPVASLVYVAGQNASREAVVWTVQPHGETRRETSSGFATFDETTLPGQPVAMAFDVSSHSQADDHGRLLVATAAADGARLVTIDAGSNAFAWRLSGVVFGVVLVGLVYLLAASMFSRRRIALLAAAFVAVDGMSFVMSRIAMNDIFAAVFIVAAYLVFWQVWSGRWQRSAWWALPLTGILIGLAAATKWIGFYALAGLLVLVLARSPLGRLLLVGLLAIAVVVAGVGAPWPFLAVTLAALLFALLITFLRPTRVRPTDAALAIPASLAVLLAVGLPFVLAYGGVEGRTPGDGIETVFSYLFRGAHAGWPLVIALGVAAVLIVVRAAVSLLSPTSDARWYRPAELGGLAWAWAGACLVIVPLTVYGLTYLPYLELGHAVATPETGPGYHWSLDELHAQMFGYHFGLQAGHASASPWWSWPLALKPTWFFSSSYDVEQLAVIYNGGNPILVWAGVPAIVAAGLLAWKRRSAALAFVVVAFAFAFLPWTRIERATFAYHYLVASIFALLAVAYMVEELLSRPAWRDVALGFLAAALAVGLLVFPMGSALPMPDWFVDGMRALPPWNYGFQFPEPPQGERGDLLAADAVKLLAGAALAVVAALAATYGREWWERLRPDHPRPVPAEAAEG